jgi:hypothetical protein
MTSPAVGFANRNLAGPIGAGQRGRFSVPRRFVPLSQFFLTTGKPEKGEKVLYGREEPPKKKTPKGAKKSSRATDAPTAPQEEAKSSAPNPDNWKRHHECAFCGSPGTHELAWDDGKAFMMVCDKHLAKGRAEMAKKADRPNSTEGITTTANVPTVPVPLGGKLDRPDGEKKKRKKRKDLPQRMTILLRRLF